MESSSDQEAEDLFDLNVYLVRVFRSCCLAEEDAARLNQLNSKKGVTYFVRYIRLADDILVGLPERE